jgi:hypothetical protein
MAQSVDYPFYEIHRGPRKGVQRFEFITAEEYLQLGAARAKVVEWNRFRSAMISADPAEKSKWSERRKHRRNTVRGLRERELAQKRVRRSAAR